MGVLPGYGSQDQAQMVVICNLIYLIQSFLIYFIIWVNFTYLSILEL